MVIVSLKVTVSPNKRRDALKTVRPILGPTRVKPGCISFACYQDPDDPNTVVLIDEWETQSDLEAHIRSDEYRNILALMDLSNEFPEIKVNTVSRTEGLDFIETVRGSRSGPHPLRGIRIHNSILRVKRGEGIRKTKRQNNCEN